MCKDFCKIKWQIKFISPRNEDESTSEQSSNYSSPIDISQASFCMANPPSLWEPLISFRLLSLRFHSINSQEFMSETFSHWGGELLSSDMIGKLSVCCQPTLCAAAYKYFVRKVVNIPSPVTRTSQSPELVITSQDDPLGSFIPTPPPLSGPL